MTNKSALVVLPEALYDPRLAKSDCAVYSFLLERSRGATARPSRERIAKATGMAAVNVARCIRKLESLGYITKTPSVGQSTNIYGFPKLSSTGINRDTCMGINPARTKEVSTVIPNKRKTEPSYPKKKKTIVSDSVSAVVRVNRPSPNHPE